MDTLHFVGGHIGSFFFRFEFPLACKALRVRRTEVATFQVLDLPPRPLGRGANRSGLTFVLLR